jgi:hypothetical protein
MSTEGHCDGMQIQWGARGWGDSDEPGDGIWRQLWSPERVFDYLSRLRDRVHSLCAVLSCGPCHSQDGWNGVHRIVKNAFIIRNRKLCHCFYQLVNTGFYRLANKKAGTFLIILVVSLWNSFSGNQTSKVWKCLSELQIWISLQVGLHSSISHNFIDFPRIQAFFTDCQRFNWLLTSESP